MQKTKLFKSNPRIFLFFTAFLVSLVFITSCNEDKKKDPDRDTPTSGATSAQTFKMNCVIITKAQIQSWVDSGWTSGPNKIKNILLQFYSGSAADANSNMQLIAYPGKSATEVKINGKQTLSIDTTCVAKELTGPVIFGNNMANLADLNIIKPDGSLTDFDYIRFIPKQNYPPYVNFKMEIVRVGVAAQVDGEGTWPCPPHCGIVEGN